MKNPPEEPVATAKFIFIRFTAIRESITFIGGYVVKNPSANAGNVGLIPGWGRSPGEATHSSILAWEVSWTRSLVGYSPWGPKKSDTT